MEIPSVRPTRFSLQTEWKDPNLRLSFNATMCILERPLWDTTSASSPIPSPSLSLGHVFLLKQDTAKPKGPGTPRGAAQVFPPLCFSSSNIKMTLPSFGQSLEIYRLKVLRVSQVSHCFQYSTAAPSGGAKLMVHYL